MANELTVDGGMLLQKSGLEVTFAKRSVQVTVSGTDAVRLTQTIGITAEALDIGDITTPGYCLMHNRDATNYVTVRMGAAGADVVKLKAGEIALFRLASTNPFAIANTAACQVDYLLVED